MRKTLLITSQPAHIGVNTPVARGQHRQPSPHLRVAVAYPPFCRGPGEFSNLMFSYKHFSVFFFSNCAIVIKSAALDFNVWFCLNFVFKLWFIFLTLVLLFRWVLRTPQHPSQTE